MLAAGQPFKAQSFNRDAVGSDPLYVWSKLRSEYEAQANIETAQTFVVNGGLGWYGPGWYWDPWYSFSHPARDGILYSPFGWGFYPPGLVWRAPHRIYSHGPLAVRCARSRQRVHPCGRLMCPAVSVRAAEVAASMAVVEAALDHTAVVVTVEQPAGPNPILKRNIKGHAMRVALFYLRQN